MKGAFLLLPLCLGSGCAPRLASGVSTAGLLERSYENYSQSTVVLSERLMQGTQADRGRLQGGDELGREAPIRTTTVITPMTPASATPAAVVPAVTVPAVTVPAVTAATAVATPVHTRVAVGRRGISRGDGARVTYVTQSIRQLAHVDATQVEVDTAVTPVTSATPVAIDTTASSATVDTAIDTAATPVVAERVIVPTAGLQQSSRKKLRIRQKQGRRAAARVVPIGQVQGVQSPVADAGVTVRLEPGSQDREAVSAAAHRGFVAVSSRTISEEGILAEGDGFKDSLGNGLGAAVVFSAQETEQVRYAEYDPFGGTEGAENDRFTVVLAEQEFCWPYRGGTFTSGYGMRGRRMHTGIDLSGPAGDTIRALFGGVVRLAKYYGTYGNCLVIRHANGLETVYAHNSRNLVGVGDRVRAGEAVGLIGRTGRSTGNHCHVEIRIQGRPINPLLVLDHSGECLQAGVLVVDRGEGGRILASNPGSGYAASALLAVNRSASTSVSAAGSSSSSSASASGGMYTVRTGDSLWAIARRYGTTVADLCRLNGIQANATLRPGKTLVIQ